ncbi:MAG: hypothetical protein WBX19_19740 [Terracidiphilus sp.]
MPVMIGSIGVQLLGQSFDRPIAQMYPTMCFERILASVLRSQEEILLPVLGSWKSALN